MNYSAMTIEELQSAGILGDEKAIVELGRRVLDFDFEGIGPLDTFCPLCGE